MPLPTFPLVVVIPVGYTPHNQLHIDDNTVLNYLLSDSQAANLFLASPDGVAGAGALRLIVNGDIAAALATIANGLIGTPSVAFASDPDTGIYRIAANRLGIVGGGIGILQVWLNGTARTVVVGDGADAAALSFNGAAGTTRDISFQTASVARWLLRVNATAEGGSAAGSDLQLISRDDAGALLRTDLQITRSNGKWTVPSTITAPGTTGNRTIDKLTGRVNIAAGGTTITVTNALVTANSIVMATIATNDTTAAIRNVVAAAGSFVINIVACTAETAINFLVLS